MEISHQVEWNDRLEELIAEEGEKCLCFAWLHGRSEALYSYRNNFIALPVIVLSTLAGTASIGAEGLFGKTDWAAVGIGLVSISVGILNTVGQYFSWAKRSEGHRIAHIVYQKLYRFISVELSLPRKERMAAGDLLKVVREQYDRLSETSPLIPDKIINEFRARFKDYTDVAKPEITNGLEKVYIYSEVKAVDGTSTPLLKLRPAPSNKGVKGMSLAKVVDALKQRSSPSNLSQTPAIVKTSPVSDSATPSAITIPVVDSPFLTVNPLHSPGTKT